MGTVRINKKNLVELSNEELIEKFDQCITEETKQIAFNGYATKTAINNSFVVKTELLKRLSTPEELQEKITVEIMGWRDLLYADIITYKEYIGYIKAEANKYDLKYKFESVIRDGKKIYRHSLIEKNYTVQVEVGQSIIDFDLEKF